MHTCINGWCLRYGSMCKKKCWAKTYSDCGCFVSFCMCIFLLEKVYLKDIKYSWCRCASEARRKHWWNRQLKDLSTSSRLPSITTLSFSTPLGLELEVVFFFFSLYFCSMEHTSFSVKLEAGHNPFSHLGWILM